LRFRPSKGGRPEKKKKRKMVNPTLEDEIKAYEVEREKLIAEEKSLRHGSLLSPRCWV